MGTKDNYSKELEQLRDYIKSPSVENAKRHLLYPIFQRLFKEKFKIENDAAGADVYIVGQLIVETKTEAKQWLKGLFQALHYHRKFGLAFRTIMIIARDYVGIWKADKLPEEAIRLSYRADINKAPNIVGKELADECTKEVITAIQNSAFYWLVPKDLVGDIFGGAKNLLMESYAINKILLNLDQDRFQINTHNFIHTIERMRSFFQSPIEAVHAFYTIVAFWDITSTVSIDEEETEISITGFKGKKHSSGIPIHRNKIQDFTRFIVTQYVFTNEGSGLTADYYFSRFDEVLAAIDPEYVKQHGIYFTNINLSKFALWFVNMTLQEDLNEKYIVLDPAAGSGNLVSSWRGRLKHKIVSELQPDLLRIIERRMKADPWHVEHGFTIVPRTADNQGLNFLDIDAETYFARLQTELSRNHVAIDKPLAFLLNPPYKNTDENVSAREIVNSEYTIHKSILDVTGDDAGKERYLVFLGQILNMARAQSEQLPGVEPLVMIFTPTSWLLPRPSFTAFRKIWDTFFAYQSGFIVSSREFFKLEGKWPLAFTIWKYGTNNSGNLNSIVVKDLTEWKTMDLSINWEDTDNNINREVQKLMREVYDIKLDNLRGNMMDYLPLIRRNDKLIKQPRYNIYRNILKEEVNQRIVSGFPLRDDRHSRIKAPHGFRDGTYVGFMDDVTPVRLRQELCNRLSNQPDRIWFYLDNRIQKVNILKCFNGPSDNRSFCAYDLESAKLIISWFAIGKAINGVYPLWANMYDIWPPKISKNQEDYWYSLCFAFVLAENRCVVTKFEAGNPVDRAPEVFVDNPLSPNNSQSFWVRVLQPQVEQTPGTNIAKILVDEITSFYKFWNLEYCKGQIIENVGLKQEAYFRYFDYPDFVTPNSGIIQIKKFAEENSRMDLLEMIANIQKLTKTLREELYRLLTDDFGYFD